MFRSGFAWLLFAAATSVAFDPPVDEQGAFRAEVHLADRVQINGIPIPASLEIENRSGQAASALIEIHGIDRWKVQTVRTGREGREASSRFAEEIGPNQAVGFPFTIHPSTDSLSALYPIHADIRITSGTTEVHLHPIALLEVESAMQGRGGNVELETLEVPPEIPFLLMDQIAASFQIQLDGADTQPISMPPTWSGMETETGAILERTSSVRRGEKSLPALAVHPPFRKAPGTARRVWRIRLPPTSPIAFGADIAIRDTHPGEPQSDGVTFRVGVDGCPLFENHTAAKTWQEVRVDLSPFAGKEIQLWLESDVGPNRDPTCDLSYWGRPWIYAGDLPKGTGETADRRIEAAKQELFQSLCSSEKTFSRPSIEHREGTALFLFGEGDDVGGVAIVPGRFGVLDAGMAIGTRNGVIGCEGFQVRLQGTDPLDFLSGFKLIEATREGNRYQVVLLKASQTYRVSLDLEPSMEGLKLHWNSDLPITDLSVGRFDRKASEIYLGVGNVIREPLSPFTMEADGHRLATRHVGLDFGQGLSLLMACSNPPDKFVADPEMKEYSLHSHQAGSFYLIPSPKSAFEAVLKYRRLARFPKAPGVESLSKRFTFDLWGGSYEKVAEDLEQAARYGLTDSIVVFHNWQRWGYDYRLPDIYPPNPKLGTLEEFKRLREVCREQGILFAPHDNYIDFYPDAEGFSYDDVCFDSSGIPIKGWMNHGRGAQAYRFRPDSMGPFLERNLEQIREGFDPDAYFVDVFSSIGAFDYWGRDGSFHGTVETILHWNSAFDRIREILGGKALQISESGTDWMVGHLDGAQCNHLRITPEETPFSWQINCEDHERIPWQDLAMHDVYALQGVGYPNRYSSGQDLYLHGMDSDDYLCDEVLTGHAPMVSRAFSRATVRKYWLLQGFLKEIGAVPMDQVEFADGDIHRQRVAYSNGARVWANRSNTDWPIEGNRVLPPYGFWAEGPKTQAGIVKVAGRTVEVSRAPGVYYADGRLVDCQGMVPLKITLRDFQPVAGRDREYTMVLEWAVFGDLPEGYQPFIHFTVPGPYGYHNTLFQAQGPWPPLTDFSTPTFTQHVKVVILDSLKETTLSIRAGIYHPIAHETRMIMGNRDGFGLLCLGEIRIDPQTGKAQATPISLEPMAPLSDLTGPVDFGWCKTSVGIRATENEAGLCLTPLPNGKPSRFYLHLPTFGLSRGATVIAESLEGVSRVIEAALEGDYLEWEIDPVDLCYRAEEQH